MTDYISRQAAIDEVNKHWINGTSLCAADKTEKGIKHIPASDVVEVVRRKDCKYWNNETDLTYCEKKSWLGTDATDYCSFGERAKA